jgi:hypothetical protein
MPSIYELLDNMLDIGMDEFTFWEMTLAEIERYAKSYQRREKNRLREKAMFYYRLGELFGVAMGRYYSNEIQYPEIYEVFNGIYDEEEVETNRQEERDR